MEDEQERSESGAPIYRHEEQEDRKLELAIGDSENIERISDHIEAHVGPVKNVFHELVSDLVHIDIHIVEPTAERNYYTLVTSGMSDRAMTAPEGAEELQFSELYICLPPDWKMGEEEFQDERNYWPIRMLKFLSRFPHEYKTWLWMGHTVPNGNPPEPFTENSGLSCAMLVSPVMLPPDFYELKIDEEKTIHFHGVIPLHEDEMNLKLAKGTEALYDGFEKHNVYELLDPSRPSSLGSEMASVDLDQDSRAFLTKMPIYVFFFIAGADGKVDKKEMNKFFELIASGDGAPSAVFREGAREIMNNPGILEDVMTNDLPNLPIHMASAKGVLETAISNPGEKNDYKLSLLFLAKEIAAASGGFLGFGSKISKEEKASIQSLADLLEVEGFQV